jgi:hypothetical protein
MSAIIRDDFIKAEFGLALLRETVEKLEGYLVKDRLPAPPDIGAEYLALYYLFYIAIERRGPGAIAFVVESAIDIGHGMTPSETREVRRTGQSGD